MILRNLNFFAQIVLCYIKEFSQKSKFYCSTHNIIKIFIEFSSFSCKLNNSGIINYSILSLSIVTKYHSNRFIELNSLEDPKNIKVPLSVLCCVTILWFPIDWIAVIGNDGNRLKIPTVSWLLFFYSPIRIFGSLIYRLDWKYFIGYILHKDHAIFLFYGIHYPN